VELDGQLLDGTSWDSASARGKVLVVNVWGSWCAPCVAEAPDLQEVWSALQSEGAPVEFMGIDFREDPARGAAFAKKAGITYPSLTDESGVLILALQGKSPTVPTTLVLDTDGRIAARVNGPVSASTLRGLVDDVVAGS
jgi:thiol-disulfide isomerase/thioredoxin